MLENLLNTGELIIHPRCVRLKDAFRNYCRQRRGGQWVDFPADGHPEEDLMDALRGGVRDAMPAGLTPGPKVGPPGPYFGGFVMNTRDLKRSKKTAGMAMVQMTSSLGPNSFPALKIGDEALPKSARKRQKAPFGVVVPSGRRSARIRPSRSAGTSPCAPHTRSSLEQMLMETARRGRGRQLIAWHSSPYSIWSAAGLRDARSWAQWASSVRGAAPECKQATLFVTAPGACFSTAHRFFSGRHTEHALTRMTGVETAMDVNSDENSKDRLADRFARLWDGGVSTPDVFAFLASHPDALSIDRLEVLLIDQEQRWRRGKGLPLRIYLSAFTDIAANGELVRALVDGDRRERRRAAGRHDVANLRTPDRASEALTQPNPAEPVHGDTEVEQEPPARVESLTGAPPDPGSKVRSTRGPSVLPATVEHLSFALDEPHHLQAEAESLREMLNKVRFTLVRRLGTGGMGVVYEAYDQERGELVALKTMRRVNPTALVWFKQEFRALSDISHPNLVNLYELFAVEDRWFFTMELVEGSDFVSYVKSRTEPVSFRVGDRETCEDKTLEPGAWGGQESESRQARFFDETRLRDALSQLAAGINALHQSGKLHRDIKPPNVLVTAEGRVVLLDFGLTADLESLARQQAVDRQIVGTVGHMSPEQSAGLSVTAASDWYSVGVMLFEAMTGRLPFSGSPDEVLNAKQTQSPPSPDSLVLGLPEDLVRLCVALLQRVPSRRPKGRDVITQLRGQVPESADVPEFSRSLPLIGRSRHRQMLEARFASLQREATESVFVFGRTGTGKTTLIRSFLDELVEKDDAVVLFGRCYERESVPYKALDSLIDALARHLKGLPARETSSLLPLDVAFLARVFPVLQSVEAVALARRESSEMPDQQELRRRAFGALRELLKRLGDRKPLILAVDDLQWGDIDSAILLADLICSTQPPILLFIGCFRSEDLERSAFLSEIRKSIGAGPGPLDHRELAVEALTQSEARELTLALLGRDDAVSRAQAHMVGRESGGNPLFIDELVRHIQSGEPTDNWDKIGQLDLDEVLWARIQRQPEEARRLLGVVAVSGRPIRQALAFQATELGVGGRVALASLRSARLIRCIGRTQQDEVETYHDRIRETVVAHLSPAALRWHHERLALVLATAGPVDPEVLAGHFRGAGDFVRAYDYYSRAADQASTALAFDHAARLYRVALELYQGADNQAPVLWKKLGHALANAGSGTEAAQAYLKAALGATAAETLDIKRLASIQLLISGHVEDGLALLRTLLGPLGMTMPDTAQHAQLSLLWHRLLLRLRGLKYRNRDESEVSAMDLTRIDLCWSAVAGLSMIEPIRGAEFQTRGLLLALKAGEPSRIARSLAMEAAHRSSAGIADSRTTTLLRAAEDIAQRLDSPYLHGMIAMVRGAGSLLHGRWKPAQTAFDQAEQLFRNRCTGVTWERDTVHNLVLWALIEMGEVAELKRRWTVLYRESQERGDLYAARVLTAFYMTMIKLAKNEKVESEKELEEFVDGRDLRRFNLQHSSAFESLIHLYLYRGDVSNAWARLGAIWPAYSQSMLLRIGMIRIHMRELRGRSALAMAERAVDPDVFLRQAKEDARSLERERQAWALAHAHYLKAGIAACEGDKVRSVRELTFAVEDYERAEMPLRAQILRFRLGEIESDALTRERRDAAEMWIRGQGIVSPARWAGMYAPGFLKISTESIETSY
jgi:eukaryotic-like serine/threonine-protein kinase